MPAVYAKIRTCAYLFIAFFLSVAVSGCGGGMIGYTPWDMNASVATVTKDPEKLPDISWQTTGQRRALTRQSEIFAAEQSRALRQTPQQNMSYPAEEAGNAPATYRPAMQQARKAAPVLKPRGKATAALLLPLSGKHAALGQGMLKAAQMALFDVGSAHFELVPRDTKSTPEGAQMAAKEALAAGADIILGPVFSDDLKAVRAVTAFQRVPVVSFSTDWSQAGGDVYVMGFLPFMQVARVVRYAQDHGLYRTAVYAPQTEYSDLAISALRRTGVYVTRQDRYSPMQTDVSFLVEDFVNVSRTGEETFDFEMLFLPVGGESVKALASLFDQNGVKSSAIRFIGTGLWDDPALHSVPVLYGGWYAAPDPKLRRDFERRYESNYAARAPRLATLAYDATALAAVLAHTDGNPYDRQKITNPRGFAGLDGIFRFRPDGLPERGLAVLEIQQGKSVVIDPAPTAFVSPSGS
ncbi:MAG: penicillin-binding protein activator [Alphaproteobacteria bacterium]|nr:penicillin-binding protein activator [Alphaproteobacteria bacterium]